MSSLSVVEAGWKVLCLCGGGLVERALFLNWRYGGMSSVSVVESGWNELCFCGGARME
jgi:hypothetical protein